MTNTPRSLTAPIVLASAATLVAVLGFAAFISVGSIPSEWHQPVRVVSLLVPPTLIAISIALLLRRFGLGTFVTSWLFAVFAILGAASALLFSAGFSAGMDDADAGRPIGFLGRVTWPAALVGVLLVGAAIAVLLSALLARAHRLSWPVRTLIAGGGGMLVGIPVFASMLNPSGVATAGLTLVVALAVLGWRNGALRPAPSVAASDPTGSGRLSSDRTEGQRVSGDTTGDGRISMPAPDSGVVSIEQLEHAARTARRLGMTALVILVLVWGIGSAVGISQAGRPVATTAMGLSAGFAQLSAIPLLVAVTVLGSAHAPRLPWRRFSPIAIVGSLAGATIQVAALNPDGSALFAGAITAGLTLGAWLALTLVVVVPVTLPARIALGVAITLGGCLTWFMFVPVSGGIALAIPAAILAFGGARSFVGLPVRGRVGPTPA